jgi:hypothetical protein
MSERGSERERGGVLARAHHARHCVRARVFCYTYALEPCAIMMLRACKWMACECTIPSMWVHARFEQVIQAKKSNMPIPKRPDPIAAPPNSTQKVQQRSRMLQAIVRRLQYSQFLSAIWPPFFARSGPASPVPARQQRRRRMHTRRPRRRRRHGPAPLPPDSEA